MMYLCFFANNNREIHNESNVWHTAQRLTKSQGLDADAGFE